MIGISADIKTPHLSKLLTEAFPQLDKLVRDTTFQIQGTAQLLLRDQGAIDTGALMSSVYTVTTAHNGYSFARSEALGKRPEAQFGLPSFIPRPLQAFVVVGVYYGIYIEFGTVKMAARPYLLPALEMQRRPFKMRVLVILQTLGGKA